MAKIKAEIFSSRDSLAFCHGPRRRLKAMAFTAPCRGMVTQYITNRREQTCLQWSATGVEEWSFSWLSHDCLMTVSWLSHDCHMTVTWLSHDCLMMQKELFRIWWAMDLCRVGPGFLWNFLKFMIFSKFPCSSATTVPGFFLQIFKIIKFVLGYPALVEIFTLPNKEEVLSVSFKELSAVHFLEETSIKRVENMAGQCLLSASLAHRQRRADGFITRWQKW